jgi:hypothetical protein
LFCCENAPRWNRRSRQRGKPKGALREDLSLIDLDIGVEEFEIGKVPELVDNVFNHGERKHRLRLRPGRTGNALKMAEQLGISLDGAKAAHEVFSRHGWEILVDFETDHVPESVKS